MDDEWHVSTLNAEARAAEAARRQQLQREANIEAAEREVDEVLLEALDSRDRMTVLRFEQVLYKFMKNLSANHVDFPNLGSYHRLLLHKVVNRFQLLAQSMEESYGAAGNPGHCGIRVWKMDYSRLPNAALFKLVQVRQRRQGGSQTAPDAGVVGPIPAKGNPGMKCQPNRVLKRDPRRQAKATSQGSKNESKPQPQQSREAAYAAARARIFGESPTSSPCASHSTSPSPSPNPEAAPAAGKPKSRRRKPKASAAVSNTSAASSEWNDTDEKEGHVPDPEPVCPVMSAIPQDSEPEPERLVMSAGPDSTDSVGFKIQRGQGRELLKCCVADAEVPLEERPAGLTAPDIAEEGGDTGERSEAVDTREWIETRARRRSGVELQDPDFNRNYAYYRPTYGPPPAFYAVQPAQVAVYVEAPPPQANSQHAGANGTGPPRLVYMPAGNFAGAVPNPGNQASASQPGFAYQGLYPTAPMGMNPSYGQGAPDSRMMPVPQAQMYPQNVTQHPVPAAQARPHYGSQAPRGYFNAPRAISANNSRSPSSYQENFPPLG